MNEGDKEIQKELLNAGFGSPANISLTPTQADKDVEALCELLTEHATDWDGQQMPDLEPAKGDPTAGTLRRSVNMLHALVNENEELRLALIEADRKNETQLDEWNAAEARAIAAESKAEVMMNSDAVERGARALFCHHEGHPVGKATLDYWFGCDESSFGEDADCRRMCDDLRAEARVVLEAALSAHQGEG